MNRKLGCERELWIQRVDGIAVEFESFCNSQPTARNKVAHPLHLPPGFKNIFFPVFRTVKNVRSRV
jgi:hypothetical protein